MLLSQVQTHDISVWGYNCSKSIKITVLQVKHVMELDPQQQSKPYIHNASSSHDHTYTKMNLMHPLTCTTDRYIVGDRFHDGIKTSGDKKDTCKYHHMDLCPELKQYKSVTSEVINSKIKSVRYQSSSQQNIVHYILYNRLMDYWHNRNIIDKQYQTMLLHAHPGETVTRDELWL